MFCPKCKAEYREGILECADCGVALVESLPAKDVHPDVELIAVFETADPALLPIVKSVLEAAEIPFFVQGDEAMGLLPVGRFATGLTQKGQGMVAIIHVDKDHEERAREVLFPIESEEPGES
ncbi:MAG: DUF2007 domain-containing protein [Thermoanaerobaculia bacterium]